MDYLEMIMLEEECIDADMQSIVTENAKYRFFPKLKILAQRYPELGKYRRKVEKVDEFFKTLNKDTPSGEIHKILILLIDILTTMNEWFSVVVIFIPFVGWIYNAILKLWTLLYEQGAFELAKNDLKKCIKELEKLKSETDNEQIKDKCDQYIKEMENMLKELGSKKSTKESATEEFLEMMSLIDEECKDCDDEDSKKKDEESEEDGEDEGIDEFYSAEACQGKSKGKKVITEEDDEDEDAEDDEDTSVDESGDFRDEFYEDDAEARAALHNDVTEEFLAMMGDIE